MKIGAFILLNLFCLVAQCLASEAIRADDLVFSETDGRLHKKGRTEAYSGVVVTYQGNQIVSEETYVDGKQNGPFKHWQLALQKLLGHHIEGRFTRILHEEGFFKDGLLDGRNITRHKNGSVSYETYYANGQMIGERKGWSEDGTLTYKCVYAAGRRQGEEWKWSVGGIPTERNVYSNDVLTEANYYHPDGKLAKTVGFAPQGDGVAYVREWDRSGAEIVHHKETYPDGTVLKTFAVNSKGAIEGDYREYFPSGRLKIDAQYTNGERRGWYTEYYDNKTIKVSAEYRDGVLTRFYKEFDEGGTLRLLREYDHGTLVSEKTY